jgi:DNA-binding transcriptional ArsR family regulator
MASPDPTNHALLAALCHPLRRRILRAMPEDDKGEVSPRELARELDEGLTHVSYHIHVLVECGAAKLVRTEKTRGATCHFYRRTVEPEWAKEVLAKPEPEEDS